MLAKKHIKHIPGLGDRVEMFHRTEDGFVAVMMAPVDAQHALHADPKHWTLEKPEPVMEMPEPKAEKPELKVVDKDKE